jgi:hypothetical protein
MSATRWNLKRGSRVTAVATATSSSSIVAQVDNPTDNVVPQKETSNIQSTILQSRVVEIQTHDVDFAADELVLSSSAFSSWSKGCYVCLRSLPSISAPNSSTSVNIGSDGYSALSTADGEIEKESKLNERNSVETTMIFTQNANSNSAAVKTASSNSSIGHSDTGRQARINLIRRPTSDVSGVIDEASRQGALVIKLTSEPRILQGSLVASLRRDLASAAGLNPRQPVEFRLIATDNLFSRSSTVNVEGVGANGPRSSSGEGGGIVMSGTFSRDSYQEQHPDRNIPDQNIFALEHVEFSFKDQHASRSSMWRFRLALSAANECLHIGQSIQRAGLRMTVKELGSRMIGSRSKGGYSRLGELLPVISGVVTADTKITFRSRSSKIVLLIQLSREMYTFDNDGTSRFEVLMNQFLPALFSRWSSSGATHSLSVVFFARTQYAISLQDLISLIGNQGLGSEMTSSLAERSLFLNADGMLCEDIYYPVVDNFVAGGNIPPAEYFVPQSGLHSEWNHLMNLIKKAFYTFPKVAKWTSNALNSTPLTANSLRKVLFPSSKLLSSLFKASDTKCNSGNAFLLNHGAPTLSSKGNFLEAINLSLNNMDRHHVDRDMERMGCNVIVLTAGDGTFEVDPALAQMTKQRMMDNGCGCDTVCFSRPPLHNVPLFVTRTPRNISSGVSKPAVSLDRIDSDGDLFRQQSVGETKSNDDTSATQWSIGYSMPHWLHCSFFGYGSVNMDSKTNLSSKSNVSFHANKDLRDLLKSRNSALLKSNYLSSAKNWPFTPLSSSLHFSLYWPRNSVNCTANPTLLLEIIRLQEKHPNHLKDTFQHQQHNHHDDLLLNETDSLAFFPLQERNHRFRGAEHSIASISSNFGHVLIDIEPSDSSITTLRNSSQKQIAHETWRPWGNIVDKLTQEQKQDLFEKSRLSPQNKPLLQLTNNETFSVDEFFKSSPINIVPGLPAAETSQFENLSSELSHFDAHDSTLFASKAKSTDSPLVLTQEHARAQPLSRTRSYGLDKTSSSLLPNVKSVPASYESLSSFARSRAIHLFLPSIPGDSDSSTSSNTPQLMAKDEAIRNSMTRSRSYKEILFEDESLNAPTRISLKDVSFIASSPMTKYCALPLMDEFFRPKGVVSVTESDPSLQMLSDTFIALTLATFSPNSFITAVRAQQLINNQEQESAASGAMIKASSSSLASPSRPFLRQNSMSMLSLAALEGGGKCSPETLVKTQTSLSDATVGINNLESAPGADIAPGKSILAALDPSRGGLVGRSILSASSNLPLPLPQSSFVVQAGGLSVSFAEDSSAKSNALGISSGMDIGLDLTLDAGSGSSELADQLKPLTIFEHMKQPAVTTTPTLSAINQRSYGRSSRANQRSRPTAHSVFTNERAVSPTRLLPSLSSSSSFHAQPSSSSASSTLSQSFISQLFSIQVDIFPPGAGAGVSSDCSYFLPPAAGAALNPFRRRRGDFQLATANRRRWWHLFPADQVAEQQITTPSNISAPDQEKENEASASVDDEYGLERTLSTFVPNWKSLGEPAIMPLTTDFLPSETELRNQFAESVYSIALPMKNDKKNVENYNARNEEAYLENSSDGSAIQMSREHKEIFHAKIVEEMICQRLAQDFQVVELSGNVLLRESHAENASVDDASSSTSFLSSISIPKAGIRRSRLLSEGNLAAGGGGSGSGGGGGGSGGGIPPPSESTSRGAPEKGWIVKPNSSLRKTFVLSMGHYIHVLAWNIQDEYVEVSMYFRRPGVVQKSTSSSSSSSSNALSSSSRHQQQQHSQYPSSSNFGNTNSSSNVWATSPFWTAPSPWSSGIRGPLSPTMSGALHSSDAQSQGNMSSRSISNGLALNLQRASSYTSVSVPILKTAKISLDQESSQDLQQPKTLKGVSSSNNFSFLDLPTEAAADVSSSYRSTDGSANMSANTSALNASGSLTAQVKLHLAGDVLGATILTSLARLFAPAFVDASGTFRYRFSILCPLRKVAVPSGRTFRISSSAIKVLHLQGGGGGGGGGGIGGGGGGGAGGGPSVSSLIQFPPLLRSSSSTPMVGLPAPIPLAMSFSSSAVFDKTPSTTPSFGPRSPTASMNNAASGSSGYTSAGSVGSGGGGHSKLQFQGPSQRTSKPYDDETNWSFLDSLLVGDQLEGAHPQPLPESTRFSRICFLLLPTQPIIASSATNTDDDEYQNRCASVIAGFKRFWETHISKFGPALKCATDGTCNVSIFSPFSSQSKLINETKKVTGYGDVEAISSETFVSVDNSSLLTSQRIELDSLGPAPFEWAVLHYGSIYNPLRTFPITLQWIAASPVAIENFITETSRRARQNGFNIQQIAEYTRKAPPVYQSMQNAASESSSNSSLAFLNPSLNAADNLPSSSKSISTTSSSLVTFSNRAKQLITVLEEAGEESSDSIDCLGALVTSLSALQVNANRPIFDSLPSFMLTAPIPLMLTDNTSDLLKARTIALFEYALVYRFGFIQDKASNGSEAAAAAVSSSTSGTVPSSSTQSNFNLYSPILTLPLLNNLSSILMKHSVKELERVFLHLSVINSKGWYRQYLHIQRSCCVRIHANGASWLPCETKNARYDDDFESTTKKLFELVCSAAKDASEGVVLHEEAQK